MSRKYDLPFQVGQEVEAKFNEVGFRGAWFRCRILEIKDSTAELKLLLEYLDFPDEAYSWARVRQADPSFKNIEPWSKQKKPLIWMVRPEPPTVHESNVEKYKEDIRVGRKCPGSVYIYDDVYMVGDSVDWWKDDCFWAGQIVEISTETNKAKLKFPPPPLGEGVSGARWASLKDLRPSFSWGPVHRWRQLGLKRRGAGTGVKNDCNKPHIIGAYLSGDSTIPAVVVDSRCRSLSSVDTNSVCKSEHDESAINSRGTAEEQGHNNSDSHELVVTSGRLHGESKCVLGPLQSTSDTSREIKKQNVHDRVKLRKSSTTDGAKSSIKQETPDKMKPRKGRRKVRFNSSFAISDSDEEEQGSCLIPRNPVAKDGATSSRNNSDMVSGFGVLNLIPSTAHVLRRDASIAPSQPVATSPTGTGGEMESQGEMYSCLENLRNNTAVGDQMNDSVATANEDIPLVKFFIPDTALENRVSAMNSTPSNLDDRNDMINIPKPDNSLGNIADSSLRKDPKCDEAEFTVLVEDPGSCLTMENTDVLGDQTTEVDGGGTTDMPNVHLLVPGNVLENPSSPGSIAGCADDLCRLRAELYASDRGVTAPPEQITDSTCGFDDIVAEDATSKDRLGMSLHVSAETLTALKNPPGADSPTVHPKEIAQELYDFESVVGVVTPNHGALILVPDRTEITLQNTTRDNNHGESEVCAPGGDLNEEQAIGSPTNVVTKGTSGRMKLSHRSCLALKKAIEIGCFRKRRQEKEQLNTSRKRLCQGDTNQSVDGFLGKPLSTSGPPTSANTERMSSVFGSAVKPEPGTYEEENRMHALEPLWVLALPSNGEGQFPAVTHPLITPSETEQQRPSNSADFNCVHVTTPHDMEQQCPPDPIENSDLKDDLDALEKLIARIHVLGAHLQRDKVQKRKKIIWKISDGSVFISGGPSVAWGGKSRSRRIVTKRGTKRMKSVRSLGKCKSQSLRHPELANQFLHLGSGNVSSKAEGGLKRKLADDMGPGLQLKRMKADVSTAVVEAVRNFPTPAVELPRMRGSIKPSQRKPVRLKNSKTSQKPASLEKHLDAVMGIKEQLVESVSFQQEQQLKDSLSGGSKQKPVEKSSLNGFQTKSHLSTGSNREFSSPGKSDSQALEGESKEPKNLHQSRGNSDSVVLDNESEENKVKLQSNGNWCMKVFTVNGKVEWIGNYSSKAEALSIYDLVNRSSSSKEKGVPAPSHTSSSCPGEQADGNHSSPKPSPTEKLLKCSMLTKSTESNSSESRSSAVEPNVGSTAFIAEVNETTVGDSRLDNTSGTVEQEGAGQNISKLADTSEQIPSAISTKENAPIGFGVDTNSVPSTEGDIQGRCNTMEGATTALALTEGPSGLSCREKVVNVDKDIQSSGIVRDKPLVKVESQAPEAVPAGGTAHDSWIHDSVKCRFGKDALDRVSMDDFETTEEKEAARQAKMAFWQGVCCSPQSCRLGLDLFKRIQHFVQSKMHFLRELDNDSNKMLLSSGKPGEEIYLGHCKTEAGVNAARKILSRCKKELQKSMVSFEGSHNPQLSVAAKDLTPVVTSIQMPCRQTQVTHNERNPSIEASAAPVTDHLPSPNDPQAPLCSKAAAGPPCYSQNLVVLDDDDDNEVHVAGSTGGTAFTDVTPVGNNISAQRENTLQGNRACRTYGLLNDVVSSYPRQAQENRHVVGGSSAGGQIWINQAVPNHSQTANTGVYPIERIGQAPGAPDVQIYGRIPQPVIQGPGRQQTATTPLPFGTVVSLQQPVNPYGGTRLYVHVLDSSGRRVEIPYSRLQAMQGLVRVSTSHELVNRPSEPGNSTTVPSAVNASVASAPRSTSMRRVYNCCPGIEPSEEDFMLFKALCCSICKRLVHTDCAIALNRLRCFSIFGTDKEKVVYICECGKKWEIIPMILSRMKEFIQLIWNQQKERLNRDTPPATVIELHKGQELNVIMGTLLKILSGARSDSTLKTIFQYVRRMNQILWVDANKVNFLDMFQFIDAALRYARAT